MHENGGESMVNGFEMKMVVESGDIIFFKFCGLLGSRS